MAYLVVLLLLEVVVEEVKSLYEVDFICILADPVRCVALLLLQDLHLLKLLRINRPLHLVLNVFLGGLEGLLEAEHLIADVVAHLDGLSVLKFELFPATVLQDRLALLVRALVFAAPLFVFIDQREEDQFSAGLTSHLEYVDELLQNVGAGPHPQNSGALERAVFLPFFDAALAEKLSAVVALHRFAQDQQTDAADQRVF